MLKTAQNLIQVAHQLLQQGPEVQGSQVEGAQMKKVGRACVACQSDDEKEESLEEKVGCVSVSCQTEFETEDTEVSAASWGVAQLKAKLEEEIELWLQLRCIFSG